MYKDAPFHIISHLKFPLCTLIDKTVLLVTICLIVVHVLCVCVFMAQMITIRYFDLLLLEDIYFALSPPSHILLLLKLGNLRQVAEGAWLADLSGHSIVVPDPQALQTWHA